MAAWLLLGERLDPWSMVGAGPAIGSIVIPHVKFLLDGQEIFRQSSKHTSSERGAVFKSRQWRGDMDLRDYVHKLTDFIWEREHQSQKSVDAAILSYVQDAVIAELEYRRRMQDLDRRIAELDALTGVGAHS